MVRLQGEVIRIETRTTKLRALLAYLWLRTEDADDLQPVVVFPPEYEPVADDLEVGATVLFEGTRGEG